MKKKKKSRTNNWKYPRVQNLRFCVLAQMNCRAFGWYIRFEERLWCVTFVCNSSQNISNVSRSRQAFMREFELFKPNECCALSHISVQLPVKLKWEIWKAVADGWSFENLKIFNIFFPTFAGVHFWQFKSGYFKCRASFHQRVPGITSSICVHFSLSVCLAFLIAFQMHVYLPIFQFTSFIYISRAITKSSLKLSKFITSVVYARCCFLS